MTAEWLGMLTPASPYTAQGKAMIEDPKIYFLEHALINDRRETHLDPCPQEFVGYMQTFIGSSILYGQYGYPTDPLPLTLCAGYTSLLPILTMVPSTWLALPPG